MSTPFVKVEKSGRVVVLTLNRPETRNAFSHVSDCDELIVALREANDDRDVLVVILTGADPAFSSGGDLKTLKNRDGVGPISDLPVDTRDNYSRGVGGIMRTLQSIDVPTIAAINGPAIGLGLGVAVMCDLRVCAQSAKLASSFAKVGIVPGDGEAWSLQRAVGYARAAELILTGDPIDAEKALAIGLVNQVVPDGQSLVAAQALAERIAANPPRAVRLSKRLLREAQHSRLADILELSAAFQALAHETSDHREAVDALLNRRSPKFTGG
jgi:enoyl-CoA hydratase/carnithine racemase